MLSVSAVHYQPVATPLPASSDATKPVAATADAGGGSGPPGSQSGTAALKKWISGASSTPAADSSHTLAHAQAAYAGG